MGVNPPVNETEQVFSDEHQISLAGGGVRYPFSMSGWVESGRVTGIRYPCPMSKGKREGMAGVGRAGGRYPMHHA